MGDFPNMLDAMDEWMNPLVFKLVTKTITNFQAVETKTTVKFKGVLYPSTHQQLMLKPEGHRQWKWWTMLTSYELSPDDILIDHNESQFRVDTKADYSKAGYYQYTLQQDWVA